MTNCVQIASGSIANDEGVDAFHTWAQQETTNAIDKKKRRQKKKRKKRKKKGRVGDRQKKKDEQKGPTRRAELKRARKRVE
jgi:hypothetical protein